MKVEQRVPRLFVSLSLDFNKTLNPRVIAGGPSLPIKIILFEAKYDKTQ